MKQQPRQISQTQLIIEQIALLFASFVWTTVILSIVILVWAVQDAEANWDYILGLTPTPNSEPQELILAIEPTPTPWPSPTPSATPTKTLTPSATPTRVMQPPNILPDTPNEDDPTPVPILVHTEEEVAEFSPVDTPSTPTPVPTPTPTKPVPQESTPVPPTPSPSPPVGANPTRLVIPSVAIDSSIIPVGWNIVEQNGQRYSIWQVADFAVGWHQTSAPPGQPGNTVMAGHHNIKGEVFRNLVNVEVGDEVLIYVDDIPYHYKVELKTIVKEKGEPIEVRQKNAEWIAPTTDERITMVTCWPYTNNTHRVIVVAKPG